MKQLVLCGIGITALFLMSCSGTNFTSGGGTDATVTTNAVSTTSSTVLTTDLCDGTTTDFATTQTALLAQLQSLMSQYSSGTTTTASGTYSSYNNRNYEACRQIVSAEQIVASATGFTQQFNSVLQYVCNKVYGSNSNNQYSDYTDQQNQQGQYGDQQRGHHRPPPQDFQGQGQGQGQDQQQRPPYPPRQQFNQQPGQYGNGFYSN